MSSSGHCCGGLLRWRSASRSSTGLTPACALGMLLPLLGLTYVLDPAAQSTSLHELQFSLLTLYVAFFVLLGMMIYACVEIDKKSALYCAVWSCWPPRPAYRVLASGGSILRVAGNAPRPQKPAGHAGTTGRWCILLFVICTTLSRKMSYKGVYNIGPRQLTSAFFIGILFVS